MDSCLNRYSVSGLQDKKSSGDLLHNKMNILNTTELVKIVKFMLCVFYQ